MTANPSFIPWPKLYPRKQRCGGNNKNKTAEIAASCWWLGQGHPSKVAAGAWEGVKITLKPAALKGSCCFSLPNPACHQLHATTMMLSAPMPRLFHLCPQGLVYMCTASFCECSSSIFLPDLGACGQSSTHDWNSSSLFPQDKPPLSLLKHL